jgi:tetratricopeptide (TPR) repeat protein
MQSAVRSLERRLIHAESDRVGAMLDLATRHLERGNHEGAVTVGLETVEACAGDPLRRSDALRIVARSLFAAEAYELAATSAARAVQDAIAASDPTREARAREVQAALLMRRGRFREARAEFRIAGQRHRIARNTLAMKRTALSIGHSYRAQGIAAESNHRHEHAQMYFKQALRAYRIALVTGEFADDDAAIAAAAADCECRRGNFGLARIQIDRALVRAPRIENLAVVVEIHLVESRLHRATGDVRAAEWAGERACSAARPLRDESLIRGLLALSSVHDAQGRFERASDIETQAHDLSLERERELGQLRARLSALWSRAAEPAAALGAA